jgi:hypothetical protein
MRRVFFSKSGEFRWTLVSTLELDKCEASTGGFQAQQNHKTSIS